GHRVEHVNRSVRGRELADESGRGLEAVTKEKPAVHQIDRIELVIDLDGEGVHVGEVRRIDRQRAAWIDRVVLEQRFAYGIRGEAGASDARTCARNLGRLR